MHSERGMPSSTMHRLVEPLAFGWRLPMWDPDGAPAREWFPSALANMDALHGQFDSIWLSDHFVPGTRWMPAEPDALECWTATSYLAARYDKYRFGQIV